MGRPLALAGLEVQTTQLAVATHSVDVPVLDERRAHDAVEGHRVVGILAAAVRLPYDLRLFVAMQLKKHGTGVKRREEELVASLARLRNRHARAYLLPVAKDL